MTSVVRVGGAAIALGLVLQGCGGGSTEVAPPPAAGVLRIEFAAETLNVGQAIQASVHAGNRILQVTDATWTSSASDVAVVSVRGVVTAVGIGSSRIIATLQGRSAERAVHVVPIKVALVSLTPTAVTLAPGSRQQFVAQALDAAGRVLAGRRISWLSSDTMRATVSDDGLVTAIAPGLLSIVAISENAYSTAELRVSGPPGPVATVTVTPGTATLPLQEKLALSVLLEDAIGNVATGRPVRWQSRSPDVATVSATGEVTALKRGSAVIEAESEGRRGSATVTVVDPADAIVVTFASPESDEVVGDTLVVHVSANGRHPVTRVHARAQNKETDLAEIRVGYQGQRIAWRGMLDMSDVKYGPYELTVTAVDSAGNRGVGTIVFIRGSRVGKGGTAIPPRSK